MQPLRFQGMIRLYTPSTQSLSPQNQTAHSLTSADEEIAEPYEQAIHNQSAFTVKIKQELTTLDNEHPVWKQDFLTDGDAVDFCRHLGMNVSDGNSDHQNLRELSDWIGRSTEEQRRAFVDLAEAYTDRFIENGQLEEQYGGFTSFFSRHDKVELNPFERHEFDTLQREFPADTPHHDKLDLKPEEEQAFEDIMRRYEAY